jgi:hypothetical protein
MRHAIVNKDTLKVVNIIIWDGAEFLPPHGHLVVHCGINPCDINDTYIAETNTFCSKERYKKDQ